MGLFDFLKGAAPYRDDQLGVLERARGYWRGTASLGGEAVPVLLAGTSRGPDPGCLALARELPGQFPGLLPAIERALFEHYEPYREAAEHAEDAQPVPGLAHPGDVWGHVNLRFVRVEPLDGTLTVEIAYETAWDVEHTVAARLQRWTLLELCGSVLGA
jgi:hypothetical protein